MKTKFIVPSCVIFLTMVLAVSCQKTEKYAKIESGMEFGIWELSFNADDNYVYWPHIYTSVLGTMREKETESHQSLFGTTRQVDTTSTTASFHMAIQNAKSNSDASRYNWVVISINDSDGNYHSNAEHTITFNPGQKDSISFIAKSNDNGIIKINRELSEKIINLLCGRKPVTIQGKYEAYSLFLLGNYQYSGEYSFVLEGSPKLKKGLKLLEKRRELAEKESRKLN